MQRQLQIRMIKKYLRLKQCSNEISKNHKSLKKKHNKIREREIQRKTNEIDKEIPKEIYISPEERQIDKIRSIIIV